MPSTAPTPYALRTKFRESHVKMARTEDHTPLSLLPIPFPFPFFTGDTPCPTSPLRAMERTPAVTRRTDKDKALAAAAAAAAAMEEDGDAEMEEEAEGERVRPPPPPPLSTASAAVRGRGAGGSGGAAYPICQADKCTADLTEAKRYHRRHKVCEAHAKAAAVIVAGLRQRFCQQCSRFHELSEFDEAKRSCRRRLAGHNERRRKSTSDPQGEGSSRCMQADQDGKVPISLPGNQNYKRFQIR